MHVRFSTLIGLPVFAENEEMIVGYVSSLLIHPDTGAVEGLFVFGGSIWSMEELFLSSMDIVQWGMTIKIRRAEQLSPIEDVLRVQELLQDERSVLHQRIVGDTSKTDLGVCRDVQIDTDALMIEWIYPRTWFRWRRPIAKTSIIEITPEYILVRDGTAPAEASIDTKTGAVEEAPVVVANPQTA